MDLAQLATNAALLDALIDELIDSADENGNISAEEAKEILADYVPEEYVSTILQDDSLDFKKIPTLFKDNPAYPFIKLACGKIDRKFKRKRK